MHLAMGDPEKTDPMNTAYSASFKKAYTLGLLLPDIAKRDLIRDEKDFGRFFEGCSDDDIMTYEEYAAAEDEDKTGYIFNTAVAEAAARTNSYAQLPEDPTDEELAAFYDEYGYGSPAYVSDEEWNEDATSSYSYTAGRQAYTSRHQTWE